MFGGGEFQLGLGAYWHLCANTFGLFRDCGIPVLMSMYADYFDILKVANDEGTKPFTAVEDDELHLNHALVGGALADEWQLPIEMRAAIELHHDPKAIRGLSAYRVPDISRYFMAISQLAEYLFQRLSGMNRTCEWTKLGQACCEVLGLQDENVIGQLIKLAQKQKIHISRAIC